MAVVDYLTQLYVKARDLLEADADWQPLFQARNRIWHNPTDPVSPGVPNVGYPRKTQKGENDFPEFELKQGRIFDTLDKPQNVTFCRVPFIEEITVILTARMIMRDLSIGDANVARLATLQAWRKALPDWGLGYWVKKIGPADSPLDREIATGDTNDRLRREVTINLTIVTQFQSQQIVGGAPLRTRL